MKPKKIKTNSFAIEAAKPRNLDLHNARFQAKAGRQASKVTYNRAQSKREISAEAY